MAPVSMREIYTIRYVISGRSVTSSYCRLSLKTKEKYEHFLMALVARCSELGRALSPRYVDADSESSTVEAFRGPLVDGVRIATGYYHLSQSPWRRMQVAGRHVV